MMKWQCDDKINVRPIEFQQRREVQPSGKVVPCQQEESKASANHTKSDNRNSSSLCLQPCPLYPAANSKTFIPDKENEDTKPRSRDENRKKEKRREQEANTR